MTHEDAGKYGAKHPAGTYCDPAIAEAIREKAENNRITCAIAHGLAEHFEVTPAEIGKTVDLLEYRIVHCQLGLFGYLPEKKIVKASDNISEKLENYLTRSAVDGKIDCVTCWGIAQTLGLKKMDVSAACELLNIKIRHCQLGAF